jgi:DNA polymerase-3 subunit alpha
MSSSQFVHLHVHSQYSILDASASIYDLVKKAKAFDMPALALTDHGNLFGAIDFYKACKDQKIKPLIGCELYLAPGKGPGACREKKKIAGHPVAYHLTVLAKNQIGYHNLCKLVSYGYTEGFYYYPRIDFDTLSRHKEGLICLSGCVQSPIAQACLNGSYEIITEYKELFGEDFYLELQNHVSTSEELQLDGILEESWLFQQYTDYVYKQEKLAACYQELAKTHGIKCVATNNVHYIERQDFRAHEILLNIQSGEPVEEWQRDSQGNPTFKTLNPKRATFASHEMYFKSHQEMQSAFKNNPEALTTTLEIADKCTLEIDLKTKHYPVFVPEHMQNKTYSKKDHTKAVEAFLLELCEQGIKKRYTEHNLNQVREKYPEKDPLQVVYDRLKYEMNIICSKEMCDYLLIVWDFINWAKKNDIPMGPGRGSGAGSIICYLTEITDIEPLQFNLFFERFINPERISYPDIDVDMCMQRRGDVINYTISRFGKDNVAQIITFGSMKAKMVLKDVGRALNIPLAKVNAIAKLIPDDLNITLEKALEKDADLAKAYESDEETKRIIDIGKKLEGCVRNTGLHAAGMIISGEPLIEHIPICIAKDSDMLVTQYSMKPVEMVGMLKVDFLGLKTLTSIKLCVDAIKKESGTRIDWINLPLDDAPTFSLLNQGKTQGIFQLESGGMQELAKQLHLDKFEEIIAVLSLYRPGPMDMIPSFIARKHGREPIEYDHPLMNEILSETYGIMVYQEQVMQIAQKLASYSLGEGDVLRRAMGKKDMKEMAKQREKFLTGAMQNGIIQETATTIFDKMEKFAEYGFNKSHAAAYGYVTYVTAYFKANYPSQWLAALMTSDRDDTEKVAKFFHEAREMGLSILPPDVNESANTFVATKSGIRFALNGIKGVGEGVVEAIIQEREKRGKFKNLYDFVKRMDPKKAGKKTTELLIEAGCFDSSGWHRDELRVSLDAMFDTVQRELKDASRGVISLFGKIEASKEPFSEPPVCPNKRTNEELLFREKALLGFFLTGHPLSSFSSMIKRIGCIPLQTIHELPLDSVFRSAFLIDEVQTRIASKSQKKFAILKITDDSGGHFELPIWPEPYEQLQHMLQENNLVWGVLSKESRDDSFQLSCRALFDLKAISEQQLQESEQIYDKIKMQLERRKAMAKRSQTADQKSGQKPKAKSAKTEAPKEEKASYQLKLDLQTLRATTILQLQRLFKSHPGSTPLEIIFCSAELEVAMLLIDETKGITPSDEFELALQSILPPKAQST